MLALVHSALPSAHSRPAAVGVALLLHALLIWGLLQVVGASRAQQTVTDTAPALVVRLLWPQPQPSTGHPESPTPPRAVAVARDPPNRADRSSRLPLVQAIIAPSEEEARAAVQPSASNLPGIAPPAPAAVPQASAPLPSAPLDLRLPTDPLAAWRRRSPALDDLRSNTARSSFESRLSAALGGDGRWVEEQLGPDRVRFKRGDTCFTAERGRDDTLDPYNRSGALRPWVVGPQQKC